MRINELERLLGEKTNENEQLKSQVAHLKMANAAERL